MCTNQSGLVILVWKPRPYEVNITCRDAEREALIRGAFGTAKFDALKLNDVNGEQ